jgi:hypothetical protein
MDVDTWKFINTFAPWFSAIGTLSAVSVSLFLARSEKPIKFEILAGHRIIIQPGTGRNYPEYLLISAINTGHRIATITNVGWEVGLFRKRHAIQVVHKDIYSSGLPAKIDDGEEARWMIPLDLDRNWIESFSKDFLMPYPRWNLFWMKLQIHTSVGKTFKRRIEKSLRLKLLEECKKQSNIVGNKSEQNTQPKQ